MKLNMRAASCAALVSALLLLIPLGLIPLGAAQAASALDTLFPGTKTLASQKWDVKAGAVVQWKQTLDRFQEQQARCEPADGCGKFKALVQQLSGLSTAEQFKTVLHAEHSIVYMEDIKASGKTDLWATPYETLSTNTGDTEDYAILAYFALRAAGMPKEAMRVIAVRLPSLGGVGHAVLAIDTTPEPLILDNRSPLPMRASLLGKEMKPVIGLNEDTWWYYVAAAQ